MGLMLGEVVPSFIKLSNANPISIQMIMFGLFLVFLGVLFWVFGCIAARCHSLLYDRWFK
ncbi:hypothetical protein BIY22_19220 [Vibrio panuliri]|uniref:Uncharacterized protein n=2 Tax=Vibrio panuliri TaxID=1381081 RepID=A0A1Q9HHY4_9VIBR|nr:hypothetical protein BIY22_19220 [Vibrio panuliri]